jgi:hypothetical protein
MNTEQLRLEFSEQSSEQEKEQKRIEENRKIGERIAASKQKNKISSEQRMNFIKTQLDEGKTVVITPMS